MHHKLIDSILLLIYIYCLWIFTLLDEYLIFIICLILLSALGSKSRVRVGTWNAIDWFFLFFFWYSGRYSGHAGLRAFLQLTLLKWTMNLISALGQPEQSSKSWGWSFLEFWDFDWAWSGVKWENWKAAYVGIWLDI